MRKFSYIVSVLTIVFSYSAYSQTNLQFLSKSSASKNLATSDEFVSRLSKFDMSARMKTDRMVLKDEFVTFVASSTLDWSDDDILKVTEAFDSVKTQLKKLKISLPNEIAVILTDGKEEGNAAYTRGNSIILQRDKLSSGVELQRLIAHELLHIFTRNNPSVKDRLYQIIGFHAVNELEFPDALIHRKITNPDAPLNNYAIKVAYNNEQLWVSPILFSATETYIPSKGGAFFDYLQFKLLVIADDKGAKRNNPEKPRILDVSQVSGYFEQIGKNTNYIIHPEEILADNFALAVLGIPNTPTPEIIKKISEVFEQSRSNKSMHRPEQGGDH